jgi:CheY-like chemotaxis protein
MTKHVVAVDDSADDLLFLKEAWTEAGAVSLLKTFQKPEAALAYLQDGGEAALLLVDFKMREMNGAQMIAQLRKDHKRLTPAIVISTSDQPCDMKEAYHAGANAYVVKPFRINELVDLVRRIEAFWMNANRVVDA